MPGGTLLRLDGVNKRYGEVKALSDVSFGLVEGEAVGYLGPNGAGKTTTLKLIAGLTRPDAGKVSVCGLDPVRERRKALSRVGVLVETPGILPYVTGEDFLRHIAEVRGLALKDRTPAMKKAAGELQVADILPRPLGTLSTGLLRRVLVASVLVGDPEILILDEPTLGLDPAARADLRTMLKGLSRQGRTILMSTHLLEDVEEVCGRVLFLRGGHLAGDERLSNGSVAGARDSVRSVRVRVMDVVSPADLDRALSGKAEVEASADREFIMRFKGGDEEQSGLVRALVQGGVRVVQVEAVGTDLASLYMSKVGREESV
jgi:ABC-2 type transport system ATP-binding protein